MKELIFKHWITTITAIVVIILELLVVFGVLSFEEGSIFQTYVAELIAAIGAIILLFSKDYNKK